MLQEHLLSSFFKTALNNVPSLALEKLNDVFEIYFLFVEHITATTGRLPGSRRAS